MLLFNLFQQSNWFQQYKTQYNYNYKHFNERRLDMTPRDIIILQYSRDVHALHNNKVKPNGTTTIM